MDQGFDGIARLPDGRSLSYRESGDPTGAPVLFLHGLPGSRYQCPDDGSAREQRVRLIAPERPGFGLSDPRPESYSLSSWADDVAALADALGIERFAVIGYSLGGAYALACAHELQGRVTRLGLVSSLAPLDVAENWEGWGGIRAFYELARTDVAALRAAVEPFGSPEAFVAGLANSACPADQQMLAAPSLRNRWVRDARETLRFGTDAAVRDLCSGAQDWGIDLRDLSVPTWVWHGLSDLSSPIAMGRYFGAAIRDCRSKLYSGEGHFLIFTHWDEILCAMQR